MCRLNFSKAIVLQLLWCWATSAYAQDYVQKRIQAADLEFNNKNYGIALESYQFESGIDPENASIKKRIALCFFGLRSFDEAGACLKNLEKTPVWNDTLSKLYTSCLMAHHNYSEAVLREKAMPSPSSLTLVACDSAMNWLKKPNGQAKNLKEINSKYNEMSPTPWSDKLIFTSNRPSLKIKVQSSRDLNDFYDFYIASPIANNQWSVPRLFSNNINSIDNEGSIGFSANEDTLYFSRNSERGHGLVKLHQSVKKGANWSAPKGFMLNDTSASFAQPSISGDGKLFFFASNMPGGYGGTDIYVCLLIDSSWSMPINLGGNINTSSNEIFPFIDSTGHLYFASEGWLGMGGYDIFISRQIDGVWQQAKNLKAPINSGSDDFGYSSSKKGQIYFTSNRPGGEGGDDIYKFQYFTPAK